MTHSATPGPCGLTIPQIIDFAGGLRRATIRIGMTDSAELNALCVSIGAVLTEELRRGQAGNAVSDYEDRVRQLMPQAFAELSAPGVRESCFAIGWSTGPALEEDHRLRCAVAVLGAIKGMQAILGASTSEMRDSLVWVQAILGLGEFFGVRPETAQRARRSGSRRHRRKRRGAN